MSLTATQEIPARPIPKSPWTQRALFPARALAKTLGAIFVTPFDILLGLLVVVIAIVELTGRAPIGLYVFSTFVLAADVFERYNGAQKKVGSSDVPDNMMGKGNTPEKVPKHG